MPTRKVKKLKTDRPADIVMNELGVASTHWDLQEHLNGCLVGYQNVRGFPAAIFFAFEAISGISHDVDLRAQAHKLDPTQLDPEWKLNPRADVSVPWIWIHSLATAWERYKRGARPLGHAFGLEGKQGKSPAAKKMLHMLDQRAIARWIGMRTTSDPSLTITQAIQDAAEKFGKSDVTIKRAWARLARPRKTVSRKYHDFPEVVM